MQQCQWGKMKTKKKRALVEKLRLVLFYPTINTSSLRVLHIMIIIVTSGTHGPSVTSKTTLKPCFFPWEPVFLNLPSSCMTGYYLRGYPNDSISAGTWNNFDFSGNTKSVSSFLQIIAKWGWFILPSHNKVTAIELWETQKNKVFSLI